MTYHSHRDAQGTGDWIMGAVKSNPEGLLLLAAGCALLLRSGASGRTLTLTNAWDRRAPGGNARVRTMGRGKLALASRKPFPRLPIAPATTRRM